MNADSIQKEANRLHRKYLDVGSMQSEFIGKYHNNHIKILQEIAKHLEASDTKKSSEIFKKLGTIFAKQSVQDELTLEEAVDGNIFLKQALWKKIKEERLLKKISIEDFFVLSQNVGTYIDVLTSELAFTYHQELQYVENNLRYLSEASKILSSSLDYQTTLNAIATLAVPEISDWCSVDILDENSKLRQVAVAHKDAKKIKWAKELRKQQTIDMNAPTGIANVLRTGKSEIYPHITDSMLVAASKTKKELRLIRSIGLTSVMIVPIFSEKKPIGTISFVTTETSRHYNHGDLLMAEELGTRASVAIENSKLYKGSQDAITLRDDFISIASHELKTPVTSVKMFTQVLKKHSEQIGDAKAVNHLSRMDKQLNKLTELIYDLLNISRIQAGKMEFNKNLFDFDHAVTEIIDILSQTVTRHTFKVYGRTNKKVRGDQERIGQVVNNLISNAIKYSPKSKKIIVKLTTDRDNVYVAVRDFGIGIGKVYLDKIFERFYRVYDANNKTYPGLGIGLYISSEIIKRHGGKLWVDSKVGKGSTFHFSIPINGKKSLKL